MRDQVHPGEAGDLYIPVISLNRDLPLEEGAGPSAAIDAPAELRLAGPQSPVRLPGTDAQELPLDLRRHPKALMHPAGRDSQGGGSGFCRAYQG